MENKELQEVQQEVQQEDEIDEIVRLKRENKQLRETTVPLEKYEKVRRALANDSSLSSDEREPSEEDKYNTYISKVKTLTENRYGNNDLAQAQDLIYVHDYIKDTTNTDIFLPQAGDFNEQDIANAERLAELYHYAIDSSNGDNAVFRAQFGSKIITPNQFKKYELKK